MPMAREEYETLLNELLTPELETSRRTDILQTLRVDYTGVQNDFESLTKTNEKYQRDNDDLIVSNSKLFRQLGTVGTPEEPKAVQKEFSETITLEELEKRV
jgi:hypothetical protein